jgi:tetratricopeptide (TPR) repeat protein
MCRSRVTYWSTLLLPADFTRFPAVCRSTPLCGACNGRSGGLPKHPEINPHNEKAELGLAAAYFGLYNYDQTRRVLREAAAAHPKSATALVEMGKLDIHLLHYDDAIVELRRAVRRDSASAAAREQLGVAYQAKGDEDAALAEFNQALRLAPDSASTHYFREPFTRTAR